MALDYLNAKGYIGNLEIKNRIVMPPMGVSIGDGTGLISEKEITYYEARAKGGTGLIITSCCTVAPELAGSMGPLDPILTLPGTLERVKQLTERVHKYDTKILLQLIHPGRQGVSILNEGQQPVAPSALQETPFTEMPRELTNAECKQIIQDFIKAAALAFEGGADGVELHAAHGYLLHQFFSPRANQRTDEYGGSFENRMRFITEITEGIKAIRPKDAILSIRMNALDGFEGGLTIEDGIQIAKYVESIGFDCINLSHGTYTNAQVITEPSMYPEGIRSEQIKAVKKAVNIPVIAVNNIKRPETANKLIEEEVSDFVALGRGLLCDPEFGNKAATAPDTVRSCIGCDNCLLFASTGGHSRCSLNPYLGEESVYNENTIIRNGEGKNAVVIGGGPGGMNAAELLVAKGYSVTLLEKSDSLGGSLIPAAQGNGKDKIAWTVEGYKARLKAGGVNVVLGKAVVCADDIKEYDPTVVVVAVGGTPIVPPVAGVTLPHVRQAIDVLMNYEEIKGKQVAIVGSGMTGLETAEVLLRTGNTIRMYDMQDEIAKGAEPSNKFAAMGYLATKGVEMHVNHKMIEIAPEGVVLENLETGEKVTDIADVVILSLGVKPIKELESLKDGFEKVVYVGDCVKGGRIVDATSTGFEMLWNI